MVRISRLGTRGVRVVTKREAECGGRGGVVRRAALTRTAKSCGPDAPTLASSLAHAAKACWEAMVANKHWLAKESTYKP